MKKKLKVIISLIVILIVIGMAGAVCFNYYITKKVNSDLSMQKELIKLDVSGLDNILIDSIDANEKYAVIAYSNYDQTQGDIDEENILDSEETQVEEEQVTSLEDDYCDEEYFEEDVNWHYYLALFDIQSNKLIKNVEYENDEDSAYYVTAGKDIIELKSCSSEAEIIFDYSLNKIQDTTYDYENPWDKKDLYGAVSSSAFFYYDDNFAYTYSSTLDYSAIYFYDEFDSFYIVKTSDNYNIQKDCGHKVLFTNYTDYEDGTGESELFVMDLDNNVISNSITFEEEDNYSSISYTDFNENYVIFANTTNDGETKDVYLWNYNLNIKNTPLNESECSKVKVKDLGNKTDEICNSIKEKYDVVVKYNTEEEFYDYEVNNNYNSVMYYLEMIQLEKYLSYFPDEFYEEMLCKNLEDSITGFDEFHIYLVGSIEDSSVGAYASNTFIADESAEEEEKSILYIVYQLFNLDEDTFFHEIMHSMEYRIWNYEEEFDTNWTDLNPTNFEYEYEDYSTIYFDNEEWQDYFIYDYGMKTILEDRATVFASICTKALGETSWEKDTQAVKRKENYLIEVIQKSYPSLSSNLLLTTSISN
jgi:hypothetical protein